MATKKTYQMNTKTYKSMAEIARDLGVKRIYPKDFDKYGISVVNTDEKTETVNTIDDLVNSSFEEFTKKIKKIAFEDIINFAKNNNIDMYESIKNNSIRRMRIVMRIREIYFPGKKSESPKQSGFKNHSVEELKEFAKEKGISYRVTNEPRTQKMWIIHALLQAGFNSYMTQKSIDNNEKNEGNE